MGTFSFIKEAGEKLFLRPLWIAVFGKRRYEISLEEVYDRYRCRYDIEHLLN